jgi:ABC-type hemin transport system substrate-binding protein
LNYYQILIIYFIGKKRKQNMEGVIQTMIDRVITVDELPSFVTANFHASKVRVRKADNGISIEPVTEDVDEKNIAARFSVRQMAAR